MNDRALFFMRTEDDNEVLEEGISFGIKDKVENNSDRPNVREGE